MTRAFDKTDHQLKEALQVGQIEKAEVLLNKMRAIVAKEKAEIEAQEKLLKQAQGH